MNIELVIVCGVVVCLVVTALGNDFNNNWPDE